MKEVSEQFYKLIHVVFTKHGNRIETVINTNKDKDELLRQLKETDAPFFTDHKEASPDAPVFYTKENVFSKMKKEHFAVCLHTNTYVVF